MRRRLLLPVGRLLQPSSIPWRTYASSSTSITVQIHDIDQIAKHPLSGVNSISLSTRSGWPSWDDLDDAAMEGDLPGHHNACQVEILKALERLTSLTTDSKIHIPLSDVLELPVAHAGIDASVRYHGRTPITILAGIGIRATCEDLCLWKLSDFPTVEIADSLTRKACLQARGFSHNRSGGGVDAWRALVTAKADPLLQSYDFTADFHSRDLAKSLEYDTDKIWIDLSPFGSGFARIEGTDLDDFSVSFAQDIHDNLEYFRLHEWHAGLYESIREQSSIVRSNLKRGEDVTLNMAISIRLDRPVWQLEEKLQALLIEKLNLQDDEEVFFEERTIGKRKKQDTR